MNKVLSVSFGEIALKGKNRFYFENRLIRNIKNILNEIGENKVYKEQSKIYIEIENDYIDEAIRKLRRIFGIVNISPCYRIEKDIDEIMKSSLETLEEARKLKGIKTFKVDVNRADKRFEPNSVELAREVGAYILKNSEGFTVDVHNPDAYVHIDIRTNCYIYTDKIKAYGGLPVGTNGKGLLLLSGGIDSPVAGFLIAKRGVEISAVHYHSYPFTSERAEEKVKTLAKILTRYCGRIKLFSVNILDIQKEINAKCPEDEMTIISRRFMMRIAEKIALKEEIDALITGESLGQVASQTIKGINVTNSSVNIPVLRPLIGMDKVDITEISKDIGTYETSILPFEDCCTVFLPKHPVTRPKLEDIEESEKVLNIEELIDKAIEKMIVYKVKPE
ncbi:thiamine biosynthesis protein ThiI [Proteiniborus ethanoligenes]|uniref:Probable tRNA sulfurtransferase n=1 Tax=Proteiniborus ethanoligenes TaxID=415015 RepID=A0A1H3Q0I3_9FIRM|nr:tRNA uracil 4-sulfurtransferase ThiI [Proteiniborus ethanoligenes]SDZ06836.1 thiamine biosynthesis protein ThiI [Proteiniborus ethanoligenes]